MSTIAPKDIANGTPMKMKMADGSVVVGMWDKAKQQFVILTETNPQPQPSTPQPRKPEPQPQEDKPEPKEVTQAKQQVKDQAFTDRMREILLDNKYKRRTFAQKRGKLDPRRLAFYKTTDKIFYHDKSKQGKDYAVALLIDCSGSMRDFDKEGDRRLLEHAQEAAIALQGVLKDITELTVIVYGDRAMELEDLTQITTMGGTQELKAIKLAYKFFDKQTRKKNLMITITDGHTDDQEQVFEAISQRKGDITSVGISIVTKVKQNKTENLFVEDVVDLKTQLLATLKRQIGGGY